MCCCDDKKKNECEHPERLGDRKPGECSEEQIEECHGKEARHDCCK